ARAHRDRLPVQDAPRAAALPAATRWPPPEDLGRATRRLGCDRSLPPRHGVPRWLLGADARAVGLRGGRTPGPRGRRGDHTGRWLAARLPHRRFGPRRQPGDPRGTPRVPHVARVTAGEGASVRSLRVTAPDRNRRISVLDAGRSLDSTEPKGEARCQSLAIGSATASPGTTGWSASARRAPRGEPDSTRPRSATSARSTRAYRRPVTWPAPSIRAARRLGKWYRSWPRAATRPEWSEASSCASSRSAISRTSPRNTSPKRILRLQRAWSSTMTGFRWASGGGAPTRSARRSWRPTSRVASSTCSAA